MRVALALLTLLTACATSKPEASRPPQTGPTERPLEVYWVDVEGGAATLLVTPAGESVLIDSGYPGGRDAARVVAAARQAGLGKIDHMVVTHFHIDHFGAVSEIAALIPIVTLYDHDIATAPEEERKQDLLKAYQAVKVDRRVVIEPGDTVPLRQVPGGPPLSLRFLGAVEKFTTAGTTKSNDVICKDAKPHALDESDNKNSAVMLLSLGSFRFFDGGDLTWNTEASLVCPQDRVGPVDVMQADHHGLDLSNNPVLVKTLEPTVAVVNNGPRKGGEPATFATLKATPSIQSIYQLHRNVRVGPEQNAAPGLVANADEDCKGNLVKMSVAGDGKSYSLTIPSTNASRTYQTRSKGL